MDASLDVSTLCLSVFLMLYVFALYYSTRPQGPGAATCVSSPYIISCSLMSNSGTSFSIYDSYTALSHVSEVIRSIGTKSSVYGSIQLFYTSLGLMLIQSKFQHIWVFTHCFVPHFQGLFCLSLDPLRNIFQRPWRFCICLCSFLGSLSGQRQNTMSNSFILTAFSYTIWVFMLVETKSRN